VTGSLRGFPTGRRRSLAVQTWAGRAPMGKAVSGTEFYYDYVVGEPFLRVIPTIPPPTSFRKPGFLLWRLGFLSFGS
jgi:hypothetical protein